MGPWCLCGFILWRENIEFNECVAAVTMQVEQIHKHFEFFIFRILQHMDCSGSTGIG
jgi:hypothetical protein